MLNGLFFLYFCVTQNFGRAERWQISCNIKCYQSTGETQGFHAVLRATLTSSPQSHSWLLPCMGSQACRKRLPATAGLPGPPPPLAARIVSTHWSPAQRWGLV